MADKTVTIAKSAFAKYRYAFCLNNKSVENLTGLDGSGGDYAAAIKVLQKLNEKDVRVHENIAILEWMNRTSDATTLLNILSDLCTKHRTSETGKKNAVMLEREVAFLRYNLAAVYFYQKKYATACSILDGLWRNVEPLEDIVAVHICFLYLDVLLHLSRGGGFVNGINRTEISSKIHSVLHYLEKPNILNTRIGEASTTSDGTTREIKSAANLNQISSGAIEFRYRLNMFKAKVALVEEQIKQAKSFINTSNDIFEKEFKTKIEAKETLFGGHVPCFDAQNSAGIVLKANMEYLRKNYAKSLKLLSNCSAGGVNQCVLLNNLGCIHYQMNKYGVAQSYFARALQHANTFKPSTYPLTGPSVEYEILYNNGMQFLAMHKYTMAFKAFYAASGLYYAQPRIWYRMGECCIRALASTKQSKLNQGTVGSAMQRRIVLPVSSRLDKTRKHRCDPPEVSYSFAVECFRNVLSAFAPIVTSTVNPSGVEISTTSVHPLRSSPMGQSALVNLAYSYLCLNEPQLALKTAKELMAMPECTTANRYLAHTYASEAMILQSKALEALECLSHTVSSKHTLSDLTESFCSTQVDSKAARVYAFVNLATTHVLQVGLDSRLTLFRL